ncbi:MoxR family ATPase [Mycobacterium sp. 1423905.2]|uniref:AAA family ATPase n=1 Tax=Mycobacterium sp. 1423905.2 TaxID=1856859 RepID=UPI0008022240|nr:MoxR family ATPase [Mycobacterium sp. 1423905.2]OBJ48087.1 AAA family ATPase [Mycobacterium sp. 1423905.2]
MTTTRIQPNQQQMEHAYRVVNAISAAFARKVVGQDYLRESLLLAMLTGGHILLEGVPGLAKTTAARVIADAISGAFQRIQCTPDLLPSDIIGTQIFDSSTHTFTTQLGPVHANIVLLDEINRSSAKTQSAMLEAMEERQTTIAGQVYRIPEPFLVIATQNPVDQEGTYPLSEAQTDRFMLKEVLRYPRPEDEVEVIARIDAGVYDRDARPNPVVSLDDIVHLQSTVRNVHLDPTLIRYVSELVHVTRNPDEFLPAELARLVEYGASPRATIAFCQAARALAVLTGRNHVIPDDVRKLAHRVLRHRLILGFEAATVNVTPEMVIDAVLQSVRVP